MKSSKFNSTSLIFTLFEGLFGLMLLFNPRTFTTMIIRFFGILFLVIGIVYLIGYLKNRMSYSTVTPIAMTLLLVLGLVLTFGTNFVFGLFAFVTLLYGIVMLIYGIFKLQNYFQCKKVNARISVLALFSAIASIIVGVLVIVNPFGTDMAVLKFIGIALIVEAVIDIVDIVVAK